MSRFDMGEMVFAATDLINDELADTEPNALLAAVVTERIADPSERDDFPEYQRLEGGTLCNAPIGAKALRAGW